MPPHPHQNLPLTLLTLSIILTLAQSRVMLSIYSDQSTAFYQCVKQTGFNVIILQVDSDINGIKESNIQNIINARNAGLEVEFGYVPCRGISIVDELNLILGKVGKENFKRIWIGPQSSHPKCSWNQFSAKENCAYLQELDATFDKNNVGYGIATRRDVWQSVFGTVTSCPEVASAPLWWFPYGDQNDGIPSFVKFHPFGGWTTPYMKAYNTFEICGAIGVISYLP